MVSKDTQIAAALQTRFGSRSTISKLSSADSELFRVDYKDRDAVIVKFPQKLAHVEVAILGEFNRIGISTPKVIGELRIRCGSGSIEGYTMEFVSNAILLRDKGDEGYRRVVEGFLPRVLRKLSTVKTDGFGPFDHYGHGLYRSESAFARSILRRIKERGTDTSEYLPLAYAFMRRNGFTEQRHGVLAHTDLYNNILIGKSIYVIDPQTSVSAGPAAWDECSFRIYEAVYREEGISRQLNELINRKDTRFAFYTFLFALERYSYYRHNRKEKAPLMKEIYQRAFRRIE
ncbi:MAG: hypothetical protein KGH94_00570 [Candidatus Micrarchaeota archaeon]|nr:hypothetical protein [Candidatus Micrarchaeota archaeon]